MLNYSYDVPNLSQKWDHIVTKAIFDNWQFSGVTTITSGTYGNLTYSYSQRADGRAERHRLHQRRQRAGPCSPAIRICRAATAHSSVSSRRSASRRRPISTASAPRLNDEYLGPGYMNWDLSVFKNVPLGGVRRLQFRVELYNAFNSDQWTAVNTNATFDYATGTLTNPTVFGRLTGATLSARRIQLGARLNF